MNEICPSCGHLFKTGYGYTECEGCREVDLEDEEDMVDEKREVLLKKNQDFKSFPNPNLDELSNAELEKRSEILEATFVDLFDSKGSGYSAAERNDEESNS